MMTQLDLVPVDDVAPHERLRHYDELPEAAKDAFPSLLGCDPGTDVDAVAAAVDDGDVVVFIDYFRVETG